MTMHIDEMPLTVRAHNCLRVGGFVTLQQIQDATDGELLRVPGLGRLSLKEIREVQRAIAAADPQSSLHDELRDAISLLTANGYVVSWPIDRKNRSV